MAMCEKCNKTGYTPQQMAILGEMFFGPCCATPDMRPVAPPQYGQVHVLPTQQDAVEYGIEISNRVGIRAYAHYHGLSIEYERSPQQIEGWLRHQGIIGQTA